MRVDGADHEPAAVEEGDDRPRCRRVGRVDPHGQVAGPLEVCGITVSPEVIEIIAQDGVSRFYSNTHYTTAK